MALNDRKWVCSDFGPLRSVMTLAGFSVWNGSQRFMHANLGVPLIAKSFHLENSLCSSPTDEQLESATRHSGAERLH